MHHETARSTHASFASTLAKHGQTLTRQTTTILQVNIGKRCNQACHHCHVESSPLRTENMELKTVNRLLELLKGPHQIHTIDITGGAPEMNENFRYFVKSLRAMNLKVIDRCNLTIFFEENQSDTPEFLRDQQVQIVASLPCYSKNNVEKQRGRGVFSKSVEALRKLNSLGYGRNKDLTLHLVYNPVGAFLPPAQDKLQADYKKELKELFDIDFNGLYTITNMPIKRFLTDLNRQGKLEEYMQILLDAYNPQAADQVMCRNMVSVGWDGQLYDCDFNQMLEMSLGAGRSNLWSISSFNEFEGKKISTANHCYACTAGAGSSCGGSLT